MHRLYSALFSIGRDTWTTLVGLLFLLGSVCWHWFVYESSLGSSLHAGTLHLALVEPDAGILCRLLVLIAGAFLLFGVFRGERRRFAARSAIWLILAVTLSFPYLLERWEPEVALDAEALWNNMEDTSWYELDMTYNLQQQEWRLAETLYADPGSLIPINTPLRENYPIRPQAGEGVGPEGTYGRSGSALTDGIDPTLLRFARQPSVIAQVFGYSNGFLNLAGLGWFCSLIGCIVTLVGLYLPDHRGPLWLRRDGRWLLPFWIFLFAACLTPLAIADRLVEDAESAFGRGDYRMAEQDYRAAVKWKPMLKSDLLFQSKLGEITLARDCSSCPETLLYLAHSDMTYKRFADAAEDLERYRRLDPTNSKVRYWLGFVYLQKGIQLFNMGQISAASADFWRSLEYLPILAKPWWGIALSDFRTREFEPAATSVQQIVVQQSALFWKRLPQRSQSYVAQAWAAYWRGDTALAHQYYTMSLTPENW